MTTLWYVSKASPRHHVRAGVCNSSEKSRTVVTSRTCQEHHRPFTIPASIRPKTSKQPGFIYSRSLNEASGTCLCSNNPLNPSGRGGVFPLYIMTFRWDSNSNVDRSRGTTSTGSRDLRNLCLTHQLTTGMTVLTSAVQSPLCPILQRQAKPLITGSSALSHIVRWARRTHELILVPHAVALVTCVSFPCTRRPRIAFLDTEHPNS